MRGREAGTADFDRAADYVAKQFAAAGAKPAGEGGGWYQRVPMATAQPVDKGRITAGGKPLVFGADYIPGVSVTQAAVDIDAPVVFVGMGVHAPEFGHDDYAGLDVRGKVVAYLTGAPVSLQGEIRAHFANGTTKSLEAEKRGAVGAIAIVAPSQLERRPFSAYANGWDDVRMTWAKDGKPFAPSSIPGIAVLSPAGAEKLFAGAKTSFSAIAAAEKAGKAIPSVVLPAKITARLRNRLGAAESRNVIAVVPGSDPALAAEHVVLTAHLDHVGVGKAVKGDAIYNGAMDNAIGVATLIEAARQLAVNPPRRPVLLVALTAEEKGLVGSDYLARHPLPAGGEAVANVNIDMPILTYAFTDMFAFGADRSSLGGIVEGALKPMNIALTPDPDPAEGLFTRSDQYRFVQAGIPAVFLKTGFAGPGKEATAAFRGTHYHQPSDEITLPIDWNAAARFVDANVAIARGVADAPTRPAWNKGDFFGTLFKGPMAE
ncbi:aminopeptidase [Sphingomonas gilva]|uniref:Aminopeptidase n=2 Tax=Sphingomonas gilva TaxID=2305907 RepID=A0A396S591_9SPHN|nr:aminopeptidase [Sphingomonas gilva]